MIHVMLICSLGYCGIHGDGGRRNTEWPGKETREHKWSLRTRQSYEEKQQEGAGGQIIVYRVFVAMLQLSRKPGITKIYTLFPLCLSLAVALVFTRNID